ncbi:uncharacterized protein LOC134139557 [Rhea pennata]|uniref:uncharacterized protein LOC134139557 n=1 Tax=Rhea pennata TaxID=8795 RepID=UPI002E276DC5
MPGAGAAPARPFPGAEGAVAKPGPRGRCPARLPPRAPGLGLAAPSAKEGAIFYRVWLQLHDRGGRGFPHPAMAPRPASPRSLRWNQESRTQNLERFLNICRHLALFSDETSKWVKDSSLLIILPLRNRIHRRCVLRKVERHKSLLLRKLYHHAFPNLIRIRTRMQYVGAYFHSLTTRKGPLRGAQLPGDRQSLFSSRERKL